MSNAQFVINAFNTKTDTTEGDVILVAVALPGRTFEFEASRVWIDGQEVEFLVKRCNRRFSFHAVDGTETTGPHIWKNGDAK